MDTSNKLPPKYRNPADYSQLYTGRGVKPVWFIDCLSSSFTEYDLLIETQDSQKSAFKQVDWTLEQPNGVLRQDNEVLRPSNCLRCGDPFEFKSNKAHSRIYCSDACKMKAYRSAKKSQGFRLLHGFHIQTSDTVLTVQKTALTSDFSTDCKEGGKSKSVESVCNTHTKVWNPTVNYKKGAF